MDFERFVNGFLAVSSKLFRGKGLHVALARFKLAVLTFFGGLSVGAFFTRFTSDSMARDLMRADMLLFYVLTVTALLGAFFVWIDFQFLLEWRRRRHMSPILDKRGQPNKAIDGDEE